MTDSMHDAASTLADLSSLLRQAVACRAWPGGVLGIVRMEGPDLFVAHGFHTYETLRKTRVWDYVDIASLTKVVGTTAVVMRLVDLGVLALDDAVGRHLPGFPGMVPSQQTERERVTVRHLLAHASGFPAHVAFHRSVDTPPAGRSGCVQSTALCALPGTQTVYSDVGMMVLGFLLDAVCRRPWPLFLRDEILVPLGMRHTRFRLPPPLWARALPTECSGPGGAAWQGIVHDENARWLGGSAGHAGLFSTAADLCRFAGMMLRGGEGPGRRLFSEETVLQFTRPAGVVAGSSRCLGWDSPSEPCSGGKHLSPRSFGHTGFTGVSLWVDPEKKLAVCLLTNAVHPDRDLRVRNGFFEWRRRVHTAVYEALGLT